MNSTPALGIAALAALALAACSAPAEAPDSAALFGEPNFCDFYQAEGSIGAWMDESLDEADAAFAHLLDAPGAKDALDPMRDYADRMRIEGPGFETYVHEVAVSVDDSAVAQEVRDLGAGLAALFNGFATAAEDAKTPDDFMAALDQDVSAVDGQTDRAVLDAYAAQNC